MFTSHVNNNLILEDWKTRPCILATMHGKETVISPLLAEALGVTVTVPTGFNTDTFGTFTRDIIRVGNQLEAAKAKARAALSLTGADFALASEGSFGSHPNLPFIPSNLELIVLLDTKHNLEIVGYHRTNAVIARGQVVHSPAEALAVATNWGFPHQGIILRVSERSARYLYKDTVTESDLLTIANTLLGSYFRSSIFIETDLRAHRCPPRRESIRAATLDLIKQCQNLCPVCSTPGFAITEVITGLPCSTCTLPTDQPKNLRYTCQVCHHEVLEPVSTTPTADPSVCIWCNP